MEACPSCSGNHTNLSEMWLPNLIECWLTLTTQPQAPDRAQGTRTGCRALRAQADANGAGQEVVLEIGSDGDSKLWRNN